MIKQCDKGHFYDDAKSENCPLCQNDLKTSAKKDEPKETASPKKTPLSGSICFYSTFVDGFTGDGKRGGGSMVLTYNKNKNKVEFISSFSAEGCTVENKPPESLSVPKDIKYQEDLIDYIIDKKPDWKFYIDKYLSEKMPQKNDLHTKADSISASAYDSVHHDIRPDNYDYYNYYQRSFSNKEPVFGVVELLLSICIVVCIILIIILLMYMN